MDGSGPNGMGPAMTFDRVKNRITGSSPRTKLRCDSLTICSLALQAVIETAS
jgi:hypothetical protein